MVTVMVYYIRFLKPPKASQDSTLEASVRCLICITTDLGDEFYHAATRIAVAWEDCHQCTRLVGYWRWTSGMRALDIHFAIKDSFPVWPIRIHLQAGEDPPTTGNDSSFSRYNWLPKILGAFSDSFGPSGSFQVPRRVERRLGGERPDSAQLRVWEDTGESMARHIW